MKTLLVFVLLLSTQLNAKVISEQLVNPSLGDNIYFHSSSDQNGVCKAFGFSHAAKGSGRSAKIGNVLTVYISDSGLVDGAYSAGEYLSSVICINGPEANNEDGRAAFKPVLENTKLLEYPRHENSGSFFSTSSSLHGVCKNQGYSRAASKSTEIYTKAKTNTSAVIIDEHEAVLSGVATTATSAVEVIEYIVCVQSKSTDADKSE